MKFITVIEHLVEVPVQEIIMGVMYHCLGGLVIFNSQEKKHYFQPMGLPDQEQPVLIPMADDDPRLELVESLKVIRKFYNALTEPESINKEEKKIPLDNVIKVDFSKGKTR